MKIEDFLEKNEVREITIFKQLVLNNGKLTYFDMLDYLSVSKASLETDLDSIAVKIAECDLQVHIHYDGQIIALEMSDTVSLQHIYRHYLDQSIKVEIIKFLFKHQKFTITQLSQKLVISESSLYRKIKELNTHLKEFDIKIRNGQLNGEELQIRYFYFQFYYYIEDKTHLLSKYAGKQMIQAVQTLEKFLDAEISPENRQKLIIWLIISKTRITIKDQQVDNLRTRMKSYLKDPLYHKVQVMVFRYFSRYSIEVDEGEAMIHFAYLLAFSILSENDFHEYRMIRDRHAPIASVDTQVAETIIIHFNFRRLPYMLERDMYYYLTHIHTRLYFFKGDVEIYEYQEILSNEKQIVGRPLVSFADELLKVSTEKFDRESSESNSLFRTEVPKYISLLILITSKTAKVLQVGIDLKIDDLYKETFSQLLMRKMRPLNGIQTEAYEPNKTYDLILTNESPENQRIYKEARVYILSKILSDYDMENIQQIILELNT